MEEISRAEFDELFERGVRQAKRILRDRALAEDVSAEALGRLLTEGKERKHFKLIVNGLAVDLARKLSREIPAMLVSEDEAGEPELSIERLEEDGFDVLFMGQPLTLAQVEFRTDFDRAVRDIPVELDRQAFLLTAVRGLTYREAAEVLDIDHMSVHRHAERARTQIKEALVA